MGTTLKNGLSMEEKRIKLRINELSLEHKDLDDAINVLREKPFIDELQIQRMKRRKLKIKDEIQLLESK